MSYGSDERQYPVKTAQSERQELLTQLADAMEAKNGAYSERDRLVAALSKMLPAHLCRHEGADWEPDWRTIVCIHLPAGQATWHIHDSERHWFQHLEVTRGHWDGHSAAEKYDRLSQLSPVMDRENTDG